MRRKQHVFYTVAALVLICAGCQQINPVSQSDPADLKRLAEHVQNAKYIDHLFYFAEKENAEIAARRLQERGWQVEPVRKGADDDDWLVKARQPGPVKDLASWYEEQKELDQFAAGLHGEYDGWEVPAGPKPENKKSAGQ